MAYARVGSVTRRERKAARAIGFFFRRRAFDATRERSWDWKIVARAGGCPRETRRVFGFTFASPRTCRRRPLVTPAVVVVSARAPRVPSGAPHRRSRDRAHAPVDFALLVESPLLVLVDAPVDGGLHRRTGERARDAERGHADGSRHAPLRSERKTRASPRAGRVAWALSLCRLFATRRDRCL